jgi:hypothetical protein
LLLPATKKREKDEELLPCPNTLHNKYMEFR